MSVGLSGLGRVCRSLLSPSPEAWEQEMFAPRSFLERAPRWDHGSLWEAGGGVLGVPVGARLTKSCCRGWGVRVPAGKNRTGGFLPSPPRENPLLLLFGAATRTGHPSVPPCSHLKITIKQPRATQNPPKLCLAPEPGSPRDSQMFCFQKLHVKARKLNSLSACRFWLAQAFISSFDSVCSRAFHAGH